MRSVLYVVCCLISLTVATPKHARLLHRSDICTDNNRVACDDSCMPPGSVCCSDGSGTYCKSGNTCVPDGCCPVGKTCSGGGGTVTHNVLTGTGTFPGQTVTATPSFAPTSDIFDEETTTTKSTKSRSASASLAASTSLVDIQNDTTSPVAAASSTTTRRSSTSTRVLSTGGSSTSTGSAINSGSSGNGAQASNFLDRSGLNALFFIIAGRLFLV